MAPISKFLECGGSPLLFRREACFACFGSALRAMPGEASLARANAGGSSRTPYDSATC